MNVYPGQEPLEFKAYQLENIGCKDKSALTVFAEGFKNRERVKCISNFIYNATDPSLIKFHITVNKDLAQLQSHLLRPLSGVVLKTMAFG